MGFQCFIPISNKICLCLMDPIPYNINCNEKLVINLNNNNLVFELNKLFLENSDKVIFFNESYSENEVSKLVKFKPKINEQKTYKFGSNGHYIIPYETKSTFIDIKMPYFKVRKEFMKINLPIYSDGPLRPLQEKLNNEI